MSDAIDRGVKSTQEQAVASWITYLNQCRLDELVARLRQQDLNLEDALHELSELKKFIGDPCHILGSIHSKHGEIAEHMQVNISNSKNAVEGLAKEYTFEGVGRTAPADYLKNNQQIQSKFYNSLNRTVFGGIADHMEKYPDFVHKGVYDIPKDQFNEMERILKLYKNEPSQLSTSDYNLAKRIDTFLESNKLELGKDIKPSVVDYKQTQINMADRTISEEEADIQEADKERRTEAYDASKPTLQEGLKAAGASAAIEGGVAFCLSVAGKLKKKRFSEFTIDDWKDIGISTGEGTAKGGIRGGSIYVLTNFTATPANVASAYVTAAFGVASQVAALERGEISNEEFVINCETVCLDVGVSAIASLAGQVLIPIPVVGAVIGNVVGEFVYEFCKKQGSEYAQSVIMGYNNDMQELERKLSFKYMRFIMDIQSKLKRFADLEEMSFDEDVNRAFSGSIKLAYEIGVDESKILHNISQIDNYFMA